METLIFAFGSVVTLIVGAALTAGIVANNREFASADAPKSASQHPPTV